MLISMTVNGKTMADDCPPDTTLLDFLRAHRIFSVRQGCDTGNCGICTVWLDDLPVLGCSVLAVRAAGHRITTLEGVGAEAAGLQKALAGEGADQCGYCMPGLMMAALAMRRELGCDLTEAQVLDYLKGNLCRCSGYQSHTRAILSWLKGVSE